MQPLGSRNRIALLGLSVGLVLADSSVVTLALPKILVQFDVKVSTLAWALISFNLALALAAVPAAAFARRRPVGVFGVSTVVFAVASFACALSPTFGVLVGLRAVQGVAGAAVVVCGPRPALRGDRGRRFGGADLGARRDRRRLGRARDRRDPHAALRLGVDLRAAGAGRAGRRCSRFAASRRDAVPEPAERPQIAANAALLLVSGALVAALFLLVILLINGWRLEPLAAGLVVTIMPLAAIAATRFAGGIRPPWTRAASGAILISGGLAALAWLPHAGVVWTILPQIAIGAGLGLALSALTQRARPAARGRRCTAVGRSPRATRGSCSDCSC